MRISIFFVVLALFVVLPGFGGTVNILDGSVTLTVFPDVSAAPGSDFHWYFTLANTTSYYLSPSYLFDNFPVGDGIAADNPAVTEDSLNAFFGVYADGLPPGTTSYNPADPNGLFLLGFYSIDPSATSSQIGNTSGPCCTLTLGFDAFPEANFGGDSQSFTVDSDFTFVNVLSEPFHNPSDSGVPEPNLAFLTVAAIGAFAWFRARKAKLGSSE